MPLTIWLLSLFLAVAPVAKPAAVVPSRLLPSYLGFWLMEDQSTVIEVSRQGDTYVGRYAAFRKDANNAQKKALLKTYLLKDLKPDGDDLTGKVLDPKSGKDYKVSLISTGPNMLEMRVKAMGMTAHKETWTRQASAN